MLTDHFPLGTSSTLQPSNVEKEQRGVIANATAATAASAKQYTEAEKNACSLNAMLNGDTCEACP